MHYDNSQSCRRDNFSPTQMDNVGRDCRLLDHG